MSGTPHDDRVCARCGSSGGTLLDIDTGSVCHAEPYQCIHWLQVDNAALREEMELRQRLYDAHPGPREEELAALRPDKERLDWLEREGRHEVRLVVADHGAFVTRWVTKYITSYEWSARNLRAAIDHARGAA